MKKIILIRHAEAKNDSYTDQDRTLSNDGKQQLTALNNNLQKITIEENSIAKVSTAKRTRQTFAAIQSFFLPQNTQYLDQLYLADRRVLLNEIQHTANEVNTLLVLAHNPGLSNLIYDLTGKEIHCETASLHILEVPTMDWMEIDSHLDIRLIVR